MEDTVQPGRVPMEPLTPERRRAMTRRYLLDAAAIVFAERGFHGATLDQVASTAGFSKGAVYSNFKSKDDLCLALIEDRMDRLFEATSHLIERDNVPAVGVGDLFDGESLYRDDAWETLYLEFVLYARREPNAADKLAELARRERELVRSLIERECTIANAEPRLPPGQIAAIVETLFAGLATTRLIDPASVTPETVEAALSFVHACMGVADDDAHAFESPTSPTMDRHG